MACVTGSRTTSPSSSTVLRHARCRSIRATSGPPSPKQVCLQIKMTRLKIAPCLEMEPLPPFHRFKPHTALSAPHSSPCVGGGAAVPPRPEPGEGGRRQGAARAVQHRPRVVQSGQAHDGGAAGGAHAAGRRSAHPGKVGHPSSCLHMRRRFMGILWRAYSSAAVFGLESHVVSSVCGSCVIQIYEGVQCASRGAQHPVRRDYHHISRLPVNIDRLRKQITKTRRWRPYRALPQYGDAPPKLCMRGQTVLYMRKMSVWEGS